MWEAGVHGSHEALLLQATSGGVGVGVGAHGGDASALLPWLGAAAGSPPYMVMPHVGPPPFGAEAPVAGGPFGGGGYYDGGGMGSQYGLEAAPPPHVATAGGGGAAALQAGQHAGSRVVSGLLGSLQVELGRMTAREIMDAKALAASRSHSEAERRRRQRINSHLARLRSLLPNTTKTDKASLLAEVIEHVKELKRQTATMMAAAAEGEGEAAVAAARRQLMPTEADELAVDAAAADGEGRLVVRASLCCEDRPDLIPDIARALAALRLRASRAEIATLGGRVRNVLLITAAAEEDDDEDDERGAGEDDGDGCAAASHRRHELVASIQEALRSVMDRKAASSDTSSSGGGGSGSGSIKRQRMNAAQEQGSL